MLQQPLSQLPSLVILTLAGLLLQRERNREQEKRYWSSCHDPAVMNPARTTGRKIQSLTLLSGLRIERCHELWCRSKTRLGSCVAVAVAQASSCSSDWTPSLGASICRRCSPKRRPKKKKSDMCLVNLQFSLPSRQWCPLLAEQGVSRKENLTS